MLPIISKYNDVTNDRLSIQYPLQDICQKYTDYTKSGGIKYPIDAGKTGAVYVNMASKSPFASFHELSEIVTSRSIFNNFRLLTSTTTSFTYATDLYINIPHSLFAINSEVFYGLNVVEVSMSIS